LNAAGRHRSEVVDLAGDEMRKLALVESSDKTAFQVPGDICIGRLVLADEIA